MSYSDFTLKSACRAFELALDDSVELHGETPEVEPSRLLSEQLGENVPLATAIHTEKARSELIVSPILVEVRRLTDHRVSLFSGIEFEVAPELGLNGVCDFLLARSPVQSFLEAPAVVVVEAKNDNIKSGLGQCAAGMVAARIFNEREGRGPTILNGVVTTGSLWKFLRLDGSTLFLDGTEYAIDRIAKILGALLQGVGGLGEDERLLAQGSPGGIQP
jgi:hypothetical protein